ncbi:MAG: tetratricopeptide repeat protein [Candidatus Nitrosopolaris sp.]
MPLDKSWHDYNESLIERGGTNLPPTAQYTLTNKGLSLDNLGNHTGAILYYDKALAIDPKYEDALYYKGDALNSLGNYTQAIQVLDKALAIDPSDEYELNDNGWALGNISMSMLISLVVVNIACTTAHTRHIIKAPMLLDICSIFVESTTDYK